MEIYRDDIFRKLSDGPYRGLWSKPDLWYRARHYVLDVLPPLDGDGIGPDSANHVHVVLETTGENMLAVARQIALMAHYPNYDEKNGKNRTVITFCKCPPFTEGVDMPALICEVTSSMFGNLLQYCRVTYYDEVKGLFVQEENRHLPLDVEFEFTTEESGEYIGRQKELCKSNKTQEFIQIIKDSVPDTDISCINITRGMLVNMAYCTGDTIDNLPPTDNANVERYDIALNVFCNKLKAVNIYEKWKKDPDGDTYKYIDIANQLSSVFCADCFESRLKGILDIKEKAITEYLVENFDKVMKAIADGKTLNALVRSEHARWNVEKLIMGFRPLNGAERCMDESLFGKDKKEFRDKLKKGKYIENKYIHIDLCSYDDLRRVDIGNMKYDYFLMLAMPQIMLCPYIVKLGNGSGSI